MTADNSIDLLLGPCVGPWNAARFEESQNIHKTGCATMSFDKEQEDLHFSLKCF